MAHYTMDKILKTTQEKILIIICNKTEKNITADGLTYLVPIVNFSAFHLLQESYSEEIDCMITAFVVELC